jgi:hypothetical protein
MNFETRADLEVVEALKLFRPAHVHMDRMSMSTSGPEARGPEDHEKKKPDRSVGPAGFSFAPVAPTHYGVVMAS